MRSAFCQAHLITALPWPRCRLGLVPADAAASTAQEPATTSEDKPNTTKCCRSTQAHVIDLDPGNPLDRRRTTTVCWATVSEAGNKQRTVDT
jgi:hypothetical protein